MWCVFDLSLGVHCAVLYCVCNPQSFNLEWPWPWRRRRDVTLDIQEEEYKWMYCPSTLWIYMKKWNKKSPFKDTGRLYAILVTGIHAILACLQPPLHKDVAPIKVKKHVDPDLAWVTKVPVGYLETSCRRERKKHGAWRRMMLLLVEVGLGEGVFSKRLSNVCS